MSHFYGTVEGNGKTKSTRRGFKDQGLIVHAASYQGAVRTTLRHVDGVDYALVELVPWMGQGVTEVLYDGPVGGEG